MIIAILSLAIIGCKANEESLVHFYIDAKQKGNAEIDGLPEVNSFDVELYTKSNVRSPFSLPKETVQKTKIPNCWQPTVRHKKEILERYPLNQLKLKGMMRFESDVIALIKTPHDNVVNVRKGQYIGKNDGEVISIQSKKIIIKEIVLDGEGCWKKRKVALVLK